VDFSDALKLVKDGKRVRRALWRDRPERGYGGFLELVTPAALADREFMPQLVVIYGDEAVVRPFAGANWDLLADDWEIAEA
jgi:hypothetical protein